MTNLLLLIILLLTPQFCAAEDLEFGALIHPNRKYVLFSAANKDEFDLFCKFSVKAKYVDSKGANLGFREVMLKKVVVAGNVSFQEEAGHEIIADLDASYDNPTIFDVDINTASKDCTDIIEHDMLNAHYTGHMRHGDQHGEGQWRDTKGRTFVGTWVEGNKEEGTYTWPNGYKYIGSFNTGDSENNLRSGQGKLYLNEKLVYDGQWVNDKYEGKGVKYFDSYSIQGDFIGGNLHGYAIARYSDGAIWKGYYENGNLIRGAFTHLVGRAKEGEQANSTLKFCNNRVDSFYFSLGYKNNGKWVASGYYEVKGKECIFPTFSFNNKSKVYLSWKKGKVKGAFNDEQPAKFCVDKHLPFELDDNKCKTEIHPDLEFRKFYSLDWPDTAEVNKYTAE